MLTDIYGAYDGRVYESVALANPQIRDLGRVKAGETIHLPVLPAQASPLPADQYRVQLAASPNLEQTYEMYKSYLPEMPALLFPSLLASPPGCGICNRHERRLSGRGLCETGHQAAPGGAWPPGPGS